MVILWRDGLECVPLLSGNWPRIAQLANLLGWTSAKVIRIKQIYFVFIVHVTHHHSNITPFDTVVQDSSRSWYHFFHINLQLLLSWCMIHWRYFFIWIVFYLHVIFWLIPLKVNFNVWIKKWAFFFNFFFIPQHFSINTKSNCFKITFYN